MSFFKRNTVKPVAYRVIDGRKTWLHELQLGQCPPGMRVHFKNADPFDNRKENIEYISEKPGILDEIQRLFGSAYVAPVGTHDELRA